MPNNRMQRTRYRAPLMRNVSHRGRLLGEIRFMNAGSILTRSDYEEYLVYLYFGAGPDYLRKSVDRAYLDFSRTLHGMSSLTSKDVLRPGRTFIQPGRGEQGDYHQVGTLQSRSAG
jgi:hypothetical protein